MRLFRRNARVPRVPEGNPRRPVSNVRVGFVLTKASFYGCAPCADGEHGTILDDGTCACCRWSPEWKAGTFIEDVR